MNIRNRLERLENQATAHTLKDPEEMTNQEIIRELAPKYGFPPGHVPTIEEIRPFFTRRQNEYQNPA